MYRDSVGNTYDRLPPKPPTHTAKAAGSKVGRQNRLQKKHHEAYRKRTGNTGQHKHGIETGRNHQPFLTRHFNKIVRQAIRKGVS